MTYRIDTPDATHTRKVTMRMRPDLRLERQQFQGRTFWVVKDPTSLRYFQLTEEEHAVLSMLDGNVSLADIKDELERRYPPKVATYEDVQSLLQLFHGRGLVLADAFGQGAQLLRRRNEIWRQRVISKLTGVLFIRLPGVDPDRFLNWLYPKLGWMYSRWCITACVLVAITALTLVIVQIDAVYAKLPTFQQFFAARNVFWMMIALALSKVLHELGHGLTCKHYGGECHEIGIAFLVFTPCLYCDTTDSWMLANKWHRAAIGAAGMYVEMFLASICTFLWWYSQPGLLHYVCLNTVFVCSISTLMFNGNPLLRYDGYYILSDVLEVPNLWQRSRAALVGVLRHACMGLSWASDVVLPERKRLVFAFYALASICYRWMVLFFILWFLAKVFQPYGLQVIGQTLVVFVLVGLVFVPIWKVVKFFSVPGRIYQVQRKRLLATAGIVLFISLAICFVPLPHAVMTAVLVQPRDAERIYIEVPGTLEHVDVKTGDVVVAEQRLAKLINRDVRFQVERLQGQRDRQQVHLQNLQRRQGDDPDAAEQIPQAKAALEDLEERLREWQRDESRLTLASPTAGVIMPPPELPTSAGDGVTLSEWSGLPFDEENLGCFLEAGTLLCLVGDPNNMEAVLVIDQGDIELVREGQQVKIKLDEYPADTLSGRVEAVAKVELRVAPREMSHKTGGGLTTITDESDVERPLNVSYQARVRFTSTPGRLLPGFRGRAKIYADNQSLGKRLWRAFNEAFRL